MLLPRIPHLLRLSGCCLALTLGAGCDLLHRGETDERREANFQTGYNQNLQGHFDEAIRSYQRALDANPRNALAHRELGFLLREQKHDYVTAVYHLRRCQEILASRNDRDAKDPTIDDAIRESKLLLAVEFSSQIGQQQTQSRTDELKRRNEELVATVNRLTQQLAAATQGGSRPAASNTIQTIAAPQPAPQNGATTPQTTSLGPGNNGAATQPGKSGTVAPSPVPKRAPVTSHSPSTSSSTLTSTSTTPSTSKGPKTHVVRSGETPASIARSHGLTLQQLTAANRGLDARHLRVGQTLNLPDGAR